MKTPREIYKAYKIMPGLQMHQLRVAAVAQMICDNFELPIDTRRVVLAALFHDMGNIIKSDLSLFPEFLEPEGLEYWQKVKEEFVAKYGAKESFAALHIAREVGLPEDVTTLIGGLAFAKMESILREGSTELKVLEYCDMRVSPQGVVPVADRLSEGRIRYSKRESDPTSFSTNDYDKSVNALMEIEKQIFSKCRIKQDDINDVSAAPIIRQLWDYQVL